MSTPARAYTPDVISIPYVRENPCTGKFVGFFHFERVWFGLVSLSYSVSAAYCAAMSRVTGCSRQRTQRECWSVPPHFIPQEGPSVSKDLPFSINHYLHMCRTVRCRGCRYRILRRSHFFCCSSIIAQLTVSVRVMLAITKTPL